MKVDNERFGARLKELRTERELLQRELAEKLSEYCGTRTVITASAVCCWEKGTRKPRIKTLNGIAEFFDVSILYLIGASNERGKYMPISESELNSEESCQIAPADLWRYDGKPLFVKFPRTSYPSMWGIYDAPNDTIVFTTKRLKNASTVTCEFFSKEQKTDPEYYSKSSSNLKKCTQEILMKCERVYVELHNPSEYIRGMYNGWYTHNNDHTCLIDSKGHMLEYAWNGDTYTAYYEINI